MMGRKCSFCGHCGHNSRTCVSPRSLVGGDSLKLFGVQLQIATPIKKSFSMECLSNACLASSSSSPTTSSSSSSLAAIEETTEKMPTGGYLSDGLADRTQERKKGIPWSEEEHRQFLAGLEKLGKGDWRGISRNFVATRTPTQVASHAQKYFLRQSNLNKKKRRASLFDVVANSFVPQHVTGSSKSPEYYLSSKQDAPVLSLGPIGVASSETNVIDLNYSEQAQGSELPSCLGLLPTSTVSPASQPPSSVDLELTMSLSITADQNKASTSDNPVLGVDQSRLACIFMLNSYSQRKY